jgi:hypothetical protein
MIEDIYFLIGLSRRGDLVNLRNFHLGSHNIVELIRIHYKASTDKMGSQVSIHKTSNLSLQVIFLLIGKITLSTTLHQASRAHIHCVVQ